MLYNSIIKPNGKGIEMYIQSVISGVATMKISWQIPNEALNIDMQDAYGNPIGALTIVAAGETFDAVELPEVAS